MNREAAEAEVGKLLAEREELKRFGLRLGPKAEQRLKSLLLSLGWTTELMKLARQKYATQPSELAALAATAVDNPHDTTALSMLSDYLNEHHPYEPVTEPFAGWVYNNEDFSRLHPILVNNTRRSRGPVNGSQAPYSIMQSKFPITTPLAFTRKQGEQLWNVNQYRPTSETTGTVREHHLKPTRAKLSTPHVMQHLLDTNGLNDMIEAVMVHRVYRDPSRDSESYAGHENRRMSRREQVIRRLARAVGVKRYAMAKKASGESLPEHLRFTNLGAALRHYAHIGNDDAAHLAQTAISTDDLTPLSMLRDYLMDNPDHPLAKQFHWERLPEKVQLDKDLKQYVDSIRPDVRGRYGDGSLDLMLHRNHLYSDISRGADENERGASRQDRSRATDPFVTLNNAVNGLVDMGYTTRTPGPKQITHDDVAQSAARLRNQQERFNGQEYRRRRAEQTMQPDDSKAYADQWHDAAEPYLDSTRLNHPERFSANRRQGTLHRLARRLGVRRYSKADTRHQAHSLVAQFPIETALRHLANDPDNHPTIRELAKVGLTGGKDRDPANVSMALWSLHDALHEHKHPAKDWYNWMSAGDSVGLDAHTYRAAKEIHGDQERHHASIGGHPGEWWERTPEAVLHMASSAYHTDKSRGSYAARTAEAVKDRIHRRVKELAPGIGDDEIRKSIKRHAYRANKVWRDQGATLTPEEEHEHFGKRDIGPFKPRNSNIPEGLVEAEKATRYRRLLRRLARNNHSKPEGLKRYEMVAGDFIDALRRIRSEQQKGIRHTVETIAAKIGAKPASTVDALADSPHYSVPGVAQAIYSNTAPEAIHALAAWAGLTGNIPGMAVFHYRPNGPDLLHRFRMAGSGQELRNKLDKSGLTNRVLVPHRQGFDVLIPDKSGTLNDAVKNFTKQQKTELQTSRGHFKTIGSADQAKAREMFRNAVTKQEQGPVKMSRADDEAAIQRAIAENQSDSTPRHVYADWLEENSDLRDPNVNSLVNFLRNGDDMMVATVGNHGSKRGYSYYGTSLYKATKGVDGRWTWRLHKHLNDTTAGKSGKVIQRAKDEAQRLGIPFSDKVRHGMPVDVLNKIMPPAPKRQRQGTRIGGTNQYPTIMGPDTAPGA